jgi:predicted DNA-binding protein (MmcQ/YjbR family)
MAHPGGWDFWIGADMNAMAKTLAHVRGFALGFPDAREDHPWGETAIKVRGKTFVFLDGPEGELRISVKLPQSREFALEYSFTDPTHYGLGKSGWVTSSFGPDSKPPLDVLEAWVAESYRAIAPKSLGAKAFPTACPDDEKTMQSPTSKPRLVVSSRKSRATGRGR